MIEQPAITHNIQKHIIDVLMYSETARFRDLRPPKTDTNLFSYHLNALIKNNLVYKCEGGYTLTQKGLAYVDVVSTASKKLRFQSKIISMLVVQNSEGELLLMKRDKQPYINEWTLPYGKLHSSDRSVERAAQREAFEKLGLENPEVRHAGDCYIRVYTNKQLLSTTLAHVFFFTQDEVAINDNLQWVKPHKLQNYRLAPAVEEVVARTFFNDPFFFEEFIVDRSALGGVDARA